MPRTNCNKEVAVSGRRGVLQLICNLISLQMETWLAADYAEGYLLAKHCTVLIFLFAYSDFSSGGK